MMNSPTAIAVPGRLAGLAAAGLQATTLRFLITGCSAAALFFTLSVVAVEAGLSPFAGTLLAYGLAFVAAYTAQRAWTFRGRHRHRDALPRYLATQVACALLSAALARLLARDGALPPLPMAAITTLVSSTASYLLSRYWVFSQRAPARNLDGPSIAALDGTAADPSPRHSA